MAHRCAFVGLLLLGAALVGVAAVVFGTVLGPAAAVIAALLTAAALATAWLVFPLRLRWEGTAGLATGGPGTPPP